MRVYEVLIFYFCRDDIQSMNFNFRSWHHERVVSTAACDCTLKWRLKIQIGAYVKIIVVDKSDRSISKALRAVFIFKTNSFAAEIKAFVCHSGGRRCRHCCCWLEITMIDRMEELMYLWSQAWARLYSLSENNVALIVAFDAWRALFDTHVLGDSFVEVLWVETDLFVKSQNNTILVILVRIFRVFAVVGA